MKPWLIATFSLLWVWYLYYAYPGVSTIEKELNFLPQPGASPFATTEISLPPYRTYNIDVRLELPPTWYNHECGLNNIEVVLKDRYGIELATGSVTLLSTYRTYLMDICQDILFLIPSLLGLTSYQETLSGTVISGFTTISPKTLHILTKLRSFSDKHLRFYKAYIVFTQIRQSMTEIVLYIALSIGFVMTVLTVLVSSLSTTVSSLFYKRVKNG